MDSIHSFYNRRCILLGNISWRFLLLFLIFTMFIACTSSEDFANPLDSENLRTSGAPIGLTLYPGDQQVRVTWLDSGHAGIMSYKIYRRSTSYSEEPYVLIATVDAPASEYVDAQNIENDRKDSNGNILAYEYRISYVDSDGVETPDPMNPPNITEEPLRLWQTATVTPSIAPPPPVVRLSDEPRNLVVGLLWEGYEFPDDFSHFRVYSALDVGGSGPLNFFLAAEGLRDDPYYFDTRFQTDGTTKVYRVAAVDEFGVEGITTIRATSPNLPPAPPENFTAFYVPSSLFNTKYSVILSWDANKEIDLEGYQIYTENAEGERLVRRNVHRDETSITIAGEDPNIVDEVLVEKPYFISAYDNTRTEAGKRDESETTAAEQLNTIFQ